MVLPRLFADESLHELLHSSGEFSYRRSDLEESGVPLERLVKIARQRDGADCADESLKRELELLGDWLEEHGYGRVVAASSHALAAYIGTAIRGGASEEEVARRIGLLRRRSEEHTSELQSRENL